MSTEIECLYCRVIIDSRITSNVSVQEMRKHVKIHHPDKPKF